MKTLAALIDMVELALGQVTVANPRIDATAIVNEAGTYLCSCHEWSWLERQFASLDFVADQNFITLPPDFAQLVSIEVPGSLVSNVRVTTLDQILAYRSSNFTDVFSYRVALEYPDQNDTQSGSPIPRLALYPTPTTGSAGALELHYRAGWRELTQMEQAANVPVEYEALLADIVRAHARALGGNTSLAEALEPIEASRMLNKLKRKDGMSAPGLGQMKGGIVSMGSSYGSWRPFASIESAG